jgi:hypothetical protein
LSCQNGFVIFRILKSFILNLAAKYLTRAEKDRAKVIQGMGSFSQHFSFFVTYEWAQKARALDHNRLVNLASDIHSGLLGRFERYAVS